VVGYLIIFHYTFTDESDGERILKIGQHLPKLWAIKCRLFFMKHGVYVGDGISYSVDASATKQAGTTSTMFGNSIYVHV